MMIAFGVFAIILLVLGVLLILRGVKVVEVYQEGINQVLVGIVIFSAGLLFLAFTLGLLIARVVG
jgi:hypothetical protein